MDRFDQKLDETLKALRDDPPETLTNQVMAKIRDEGNIKKRPFGLWIGVTSAIACVLVVAVVFGTGVFRNAKVVQPPSAMMVSEKSATKDEEKASQANDAQATGAASDNARSGEASQPEKSLAKAPDAAPKPTSRPATPEDLKELNDQQQPGMTLQKTMESLPALNFSVKSSDTWKAWTDLRYKTQEYSSNIRAEIMTKDDKVSNSKRVYTMAATIRSADVSKWLEMAKKTVGNITGGMSFDPKSGMVKVTVTFEPK